MNGFSKEHAMTGWRVGYVAGPTDIINAINELQQYVVMSSSSIAQHAALAALSQKPKQIVERYKEKRDLIVSKLEKLGYEIHGAQGAYYIFVKAPNDLTDVELVERATEYGLIIVPGRAFSRLHGYIRISYGTNIHTLKRALDAFEQLTHNLSIG
jgi:aspartate/methionine/tyrosine aminotransferase